MRGHATRSEWTQIMKCSTHSRPFTQIALSLQKEGNTKPHKRHGTQLCSEKRTLPAYSNSASQYNRVTGIEYASALTAAAVDH